MDEDKDGLLTVSELARWIERKQTEQVIKKRNVLKKTTKKHRVNAHMPR